MTKEAIFKKLDDIWYTNSGYQKDDLSLAYDDVRKLLSDTYDQVKQETEKETVKDIISELERISEKGCVDVDKYKVYLTKAYGINAPSQSKEETENSLSDVNKNKHALQEKTSDLFLFKHGEEGTHFACKEMLEKYGNKVGCCGCQGHDCLPEKEEKK